MTIALTRRAFGSLLAAATLPARADTTASDPILGAIQTARVARAELSAAVRVMDDSDLTSVLAVYDASDRSGEARHALSRIQPTSPAGVRALVQFHADEAMSAEPESDATRVLRDIVRAVDALLRTRASPG